MNKPVLLCKNGVERDGQMELKKEVGNGGCKGAVGPHGDRAPAGTIPFLFLQTYHTYVCGVPPLVNLTLAKEIYVNVIFM